jgi:hypothetical protein
VSVNLKAAWKTFLEWVKDFVQDKAGGSDEKRLFGCAFLIAALIYAFTREAGPNVWTTAGGMAGVGVGLLIGAGAQDGIQPKITPPANPTQGAPQ